MSRGTLPGIPPEISQNKPPGTLLEIPPGGLPRISPIILHGISPVALLESMLQISSTILPWIPLERFFFRISLKIVSRNCYELSGNLPGISPMIPEIPVEFSPLIPL